MTSQEPVAEGIAQIIGWQRNCWGARQPEIHCLGCPGSHSWKDECTVAILCCKASQERCQEKQLATGHCWLLYTAAMEHLGDPILQIQDPSTGEIAPSWSPVGRACERDRSPFLLQYPSSALYWQSLTLCQLAKENCCWKNLVLFLVRRQWRVNLEQGVSQSIDNWSIKLTPKSDVWIYCLNPLVTPYHLNIKFKSFTLAYQAFYILVLGSVSSLRSNNSPFIHSSPPSLLTVPWTLHALIPPHLCLSSPSHKEFTFCSHQETDCLLRTYFVPGTVLGAGNTAVSKRSFPKSFFKYHHYLGSIFWPLSPTSRWVWCLI